MPQPPTPRPSARHAVGRRAAAAPAAEPSVGQPLAAEDLLLRVLPPLQAEAGRRWHEGREPPIEGHRRHAAAERLVADLEVAACTGPVRGEVVVVCPEGERHVLPARMAAEVWRRRGWRVRLLGPALPVARLAGHLVGRTGGSSPRPPTAVVVSASTAASLPGAARAVAAATAVGLPVVAGGAGFGDDERRAALVGATAWAPDVLTADRLLGTWEEHGAPPACAPRPDDDAVGLLELEVAAVHGSLRRAEVDPRVLGLLHHAAEVAAAREVVADDRLLDEAVGWLATALAARRVPAPGPFAALVGALRPWSPEIADGLADVLADRAR